MEGERKKNLMEHQPVEIARTGSHGGFQGRKLVPEFGPKVLTRKQRDFVNEYLKTGNATRAAMKAYNCKDYCSASAIGSRNLRILRNPIKSFLERHKFGLEELFKVMREGLGATKFEKTGPVQYSERPDHSIREKYLRHASKWLEVPAPADVEMAGEGGIVVNVYEPSLKKGAKGRFERKKAK